MESNTKELLAKRLRLAREQSGLSQGQTAKLMEMHRPTVSEIEAARRNVSSEELAKFTEIYDVSLDWLMGREESEEEEERVLMAARHLSRLKKDDLDRVIQVLQSLRDKKA